MKVNDIFTAIGIVIMAALLVFVVYDDITNSPYQMFEDMGMEVNVTGDSNISSDEVVLVHTDVANNTINVELSSKTKTESVQNSNTAVITGKFDNEDKSVQSFNTQKNNENKDIKTSSKDLKHSSFSNDHNYKVNPQNKQVKQEKQEPRITNMNPKINK